jgi:shikimate kinase
MATGKSTVGALVAGRLGWPFIDLDRAIEDEAGMSVATIFSAEGEVGFRRREAEALRRVLSRPGIVLATGGGAPCSDDSMAFMLARGRVVALEAPVEEIARRAGARSGRPLLDEVADREAAVRELLARRRPYYDRAHHRIDTAGRSADEVASEVLMALTRKVES